jgi:hypothetical protein
MRASRNASDSYLRVFPIAPPRSLRKNSIPRMIAASKAQTAMIAVWLELRPPSAMVLLPDNSW